MTSTRQRATSNLADRWLAGSGIVFTWFWLVVVVVLVSWGWINRDQGYLSPERGLGYWLGIIGASMMLLLLTYSIRKRMRFLARAFKIRRWFQFHMTLGILGPLLIVFHSNFHLGSFNSTVALVCMLLVAGSGLIGRYFYTRIHFGLYGEKIRLQEVEKDFETLKADFVKLPLNEKYRSHADKLFKEIGVLIARQKTQSGFFALRSNKRRAKKIAVALKSFVQHVESNFKESSPSGFSFDELHDSLQRDCSILLAVLQKLPGLQMFERLFSLWHVFHIPFFVLMIITTITHIVVVHMY